jgi:FkbM family methyltransferase
MARAYEIAKAFTLKWLPQGIVNQLKKSHYLRKVRDISVSDEPDLEIVEKLVDQGDSVVDLGANIGVYTVFLSRLVTDTGRVYSFEPVPTTFGFLKNNVTRLGLRNVVLRQSAITNHACRITMTIPKDEWGAENFYQASVVADGAKSRADMTVMVEGLPLDQAILADIEHMKFVKCDVEGHELHCLQGAIQLIIRSRPAWLMEVSGNPEQLGSNAAIVFAFMRDYGYGVWVFRQGRLERWVPGLRSINYLFLYSEHLERLSHKGVLAHNALAYN